MESILFYLNKFNRLVEDMYNRSEVEDILNDALKTFKTDVEKEMEKIVHMFVILLKQLFDGAGSEGVELKLNVSAIEDKTMLDDVARFAAGARSFGEQKVDNRKLVSIGDEHKRLMQELEDTKIAKQDLEKRCRQLNQDLMDMKKQQVNLKSTLNEAKSQLDSTNMSASTNIDMLKAELEELRSELAAKGGDLDLARKQAEEKIYKSKQYNQMKDMLNKKNRQIDELRQKLAKYEHDDTELLDD